MDSTINLSSGVNKWKMRKINTWAPACSFLLSNLPHAAKHELVLPQHHHTKMDCIPWTVSQIEPPPSITVPTPAMTRVTSPCQNGFQTGIFTVSHVSSYCLSLARQLCPLFPNTASWRLDVKLFIKDVNLPPSQITECSKMQLNLISCVPIRFWRQAAVPHPLDIF